MAGWEEYFQWLGRLESARISACALWEVWHWAVGIKCESDWIIHRIETFTSTFRSRRSSISDKLKPRESRSRFEFCSSHVCLLQACSYIFSSASSLENAAMPHAGSISAKPLTKGALYLKKIRWREWAPYLAAPQHELAAAITSAVLFSG